MTRPLSLHTWWRSSRLGGQRLGSGLDAGGDGIGADLKTAPERGSDGASVGAGHGDGAIEVWEASPTLALMPSRSRIGNQIDGLQAQILRGYEHACGLFPTGSTGLKAWHPDRHWAHLAPLGLLARPGATQ